MPALIELLLAAGLTPSPLPADPQVDSVVYDSRRARPGSLFVAIEGEHTDGHRHAAAAVAAGAVAVVAGRPPEPPLPAGTPLILVADPRAALAPLGARLFGDPSRSLILAGVTGTDGKTSTTTMLHAAWRGAGIPAAALSTVDFRTLDTVEPNTSRQTTLESVDLQARLRRALDQGCSHVAMEISSHSLMLHRVDEVEVAVAVVLRVTSEHLDFHGSREQYLAAKSRLVEMAGRHTGGVAILDRDDAFGYPVLSAVPVAHRLTFSAAGDPVADLVADGVVAGPEGVRFSARTPWGSAPVALRLAGRFNAANALAAVAAACVTGAPLERAVEGLGRLERVPGRMERVHSGDGQDVTVVVDYAHTAEALELVLGELRVATAGRLWAVFGSAGERDRGKRAEMGAVAARLADMVVITDEDPRDEDRAAILEEIAAGARAAGAREGDRLQVIPDRELAIETAVVGAAAGDTVLCAGKGHESGIIGPGGVSRPWDERAAAARALRLRRDRRRP
jgi:UDP-N-acetylmuramoyl-L-alanyl-D-glutamate--2,6-diaminopimelate ligase